MKLVIAALVVLLIWNGVLTGVVLAQRDQVAIAQFGVSLLNQEVGQLKVRLSVAEKQAVQSRTRERDMETVVWKIIQYLKSPEEPESKKQDQSFSQASK